MTDTVGFIRHLPRDLFAAFRATFEEAADSDLLLHVVDASDEAQDDHVRTVERVLDELGLLSIPRLLVYSKVDLLGPLERRLLERRFPEAVFVQATGRDTTRRLIERIASELAEKWDASAKGPHQVPSEAILGGDVPDRGVADAGEPTTLEQLLRAAGKRVRSHA
jgi:GTP-binding protein HflX